MLYAVKDAILRLPLADQWQHLADGPDGSALLTMHLNGRMVDANIDPQGNVRYSYAGYADNDVQTYSVPADVRFAAYEDKRSFDAPQDPHGPFCLFDDDDVKHSIAPPLSLSERHTIAAESIRSMVGIRSAA
jgi:hypothetical protein